MTDDERRAKNLQASLASQAKRHAKGLAPNDKRHGTVNGYSNWGCRCDRCREARRVYMQDGGYGWRYRQRKKLANPHRSE